MPIDCISFRDTAYVSKLICDYVENRPRTYSLYIIVIQLLENFKPQLEAKTIRIFIRKKSYFS